MSAKLSYNAKVCPIQDCAEGDLISYGEEPKYAVVLKFIEKSQNILIASFSEVRGRLCLDEFANVYPEFEYVCNYGCNYDLHPHGSCKIFSHISEIRPGCLVLKGDKVYLTVVDAARVQLGTARAIDFAEGNSIHGDNLGYGIGAFEAFDIRIATPDGSTPPITLATILPQ